MNCNLYKLVFAVVPLLCISLCAVGCNRGNQPVRVDVALTTLTETLDLWAAGKPIGECENLEPKVVAQDFDWQSGHKLFGYEIIKQKKQDANLFVTVKLELEPRQPKRQVTYCVGTDPVLTVFRTME